ncbi:hypothetical protein MMC29_004778 [Sticta canariensis]|nr:hypothetical protein [Sticta canariensis]
MISRLFRFWLLVCASQLHIHLVIAQSVAVSSTAAWSSQIVAFWGAILIGVRSSVSGRVTNAVSSIFSSVRVARRIACITTSLSRGDWVLQSGWNNGRMRTDVALICWRSPEDLRALAFRVSMQIEAFGDDWEVLVLGRELKGSQAHDSIVHWIKSPRSERLCTSKIPQTAENMFPLDEADIAEGLDMLKQTPKVHADDIAQALGLKRNTSASRCTTIGEMRGSLDAVNSQSSFSYHFTNVDNEETPYVSLSHRTGQYGSNRCSTMNCASRMYFLVHMMVASAVGLMGAASGRGLAVWLMAIRPTLQTLGAQNVAGSDVILSLISMDKSTFQYETSAGSSLLAGDVTSPKMLWWNLAGAFIIPLLELTIVCTGWLYGALRVEKIPPSGVVGHGMLWLSTVVGLSLSIRAITSIRQRLTGRLLGLLETPHFTRILVGVRFQQISVNRILQSPAYAEGVLGLIATVLNDSTAVAEATAILVAESVLRHPSVGTLIDHHVVTDILQYQYEGDHIVFQGDPATAVSVPRIYPWVQTSCCIVLTMASGCVSVIYAYCRLPSWVKIMTEILLAISVVWFGTLERSSGLPHKRDTYVCFMVSTLVISSVWYVGVKDEG